MLRFDQRPISTSLLLGASCHNEAEVKKAKKIGCDYLLISPVYNTNGKEGIGWSHFKTLSALSTCPCFALGVMKKENIKDSLEYVSTWTRLCIQLRQISIRRTSTK